jgi:hypothetical protein
MKIFISSLISGFEPFRAAARAAVESLGHEPVMAEDFGSQPHSPQIACFQGLRSADLVVLMLGERYGTPQATSGLSPTHEEFVEARGHKQILLFVQERVSPEAAQAKLIIEAQGWESGLFRDGFRTDVDLRAVITRAIHRYELAHAAGPVDTPGLVSAAQSMLGRTLPGARQGSQLLRLATASGPRTRALRPAQLEAEELRDAIQQHATFGASQRIFDKTAGVECQIEDEALLLTQESGAAIRLTEWGDIELRLPLERSSNRSRGSVLMGIIEESVLRELTLGIEFANWLLDMVDPTQRLTHLAIGAKIEASDYMGWRTQAEQDASPNSGSMRMAVSPAKPVTTDRPRAALKFDAHSIAEDLMVPLRRLWKA